jgi:hypothetical protein
MFQPNSNQTITCSFAGLAKFAVRSALACVAILSCAVAAHAQCISITSYGGSGNGTTNNSPALASAFAALPSAGGCITFPGGRYLFSTAVTLTYPASIYSLSLVGAGADATTLYFPSSNGITMKANSARQTIHVRDLAFTTGSAGSYSALTLNNSAPLGIIMLSDIVRTDFRGDDGGNGSDYWANGVNVAGQSHINFDSDTFFGSAAANTAGVGILLNGNSGASPYFGIVYNIAKCSFFWIGTGLEIGSYIQGISVTQSNFTGGGTGIWALPGGVGLAELAITGGNQFNTTINQIAIQQALTSLIMNGNLLFIQAGASGVFFDAPGNGQSTIVNNVFWGLSTSGSTGIYVGYTSAGTVVTGNTFYNLATGVNLPGTSGWNVQANGYQAVGIWVANIGANSVGVATE